MKINQDIKQQILIQVKTKRENDLHELGMLPCAQTGVTKL